MSKSLQTHGLQHARLLCLSLSPGVCSNSCPLCHWCHPTISFSVIPFSSCLQYFPASRSFPMSQLLHQVPKYCISISLSNEYSDFKFHKMKNLLIIDPSYWHYAVWWLQININWSIRIKTHRTLELHWSILYQKQLWIMQVKV